MRILFVCLGNICRSPTAEGVMRKLIAERGLDGAVRVDSAGTSGWHIGEPPDARSAAAAARRGIVLAGAGRGVTPDDFHAHDLLIAMDAANARELRRMAPSGAEHKIRRLRDWDPRGAGDVPDPYHGGPRGFDEVLDIVERSCRALLDAIS